MKRLLLALRRAFAGPRRPAARPRPAVEVLEARVTPAAPGPLRLGVLPPPAPVLAGDFTGDGRTDVARLSATGVWQVGTSDGTVFRLNHWCRGADRGAWRSLLVGDFTGDGKADIAGLDRGGQWTVGVSTGAAFRPARWGRGGPPAAWTQFLVGDFTGDGRADVAGFSLRGGWTVSASTGRGFRPMFWGAWGSPSRWANLQTADFNADGRADVAGLRHDGTWVVGLSTGAGFQSRAWGRWAASRFWTGVQVGDFDGNGRADVAGLGANGRWAVNRSTGSRFVGQAWGPWGPPGRFVDLAVGDVNRDGRADIVGLTTAGQLVAGVSTGGRFAAALWGRWPTAPAGLRLLAGDVNRDGHADVAAFTPDGRWFAARSSGRAFHVRQYGRWPLGLDAGGYFGEQPPYVPGAPWVASAPRFYYDALPFSVVGGMFFNRFDTYAAYVENFRGVLGAWLFEADALGLRSEGALRSYLARQLAAFYPAAQPLLARIAPGLGAPGYRLLLAMNLAHGYHVYGTAYESGRSLARLLRTAVGDCSEIAGLAASLARLQGVPARVLGMSFNYTSALGPFAAGHQAVYVPGLLVDAEINVAFGTDLNELATVAPPRRLQSLLDGRRVIGFYNWHLKPDVRAAQLAAGLDGGVIALFYQYYLEAVANGATVLYVIS